MVKIFYSDNSLLDYTRSEQIQRAFRASGCHGEPLKGTGGSHRDTLYPPIPHHLKYDIQRVTPSLGNRSIRGGSGTGWVWEGGREDGENFLFRQQPTGLYKVRADPAGI